MRYLLAVGFLLLCASAPASAQKITVAVVPSIPGKRSSSAKALSRKTHPPKSSSIRATPPPSQKRSGRSNSSTRRARSKAAADKAGKNAQTRSPRGDRP
jgi:hypothetical protein